MAITIKPTNKVTIKHRRVLDAYFATRKDESLYEEDKSKTEPVIHTVKKGEYLSTIAKKYKTTVSKLKKDNNIADVNEIKIGQKLTVTTKPKKEKIGDKVTFKKFNTANLGDEVYVVVETDNLQDKKVWLNVKQGKTDNPQIESDSKGLMLQHDKGIRTKAEAIVGAYAKDDKITNKDDFKNWAIFKFTLGGKDTKEEQEVLEKLTDEKAYMFLLIDAHSPNDIKVVYNGRNPDKNGDPDKRTTPNHWLDMDNKWFEVASNKRAPWMEIAIRESKKAKGCVESIEPMYSMAKSYLRFVGNKFEPTDGKRGPWCASFMNWCMNESGHKYAKSASSLAPIHPNYSKKFKKIDKPIYGCIVVYKHVDSKKWKGHTGFLYGFDKNGNYLLLGGNQGNTINIEFYGEYTSKSKTKKLYGFYVPADYEIKDTDYITEDDKNLDIVKENKKIGNPNYKIKGSKKTT